MNLENELKKYLPYLKNLQPVLDKVAKSVGYIDFKYLTITDKLPSYFVDTENDKLYLILGKDEIENARLFISFTNSDKFYFDIFQASQLNSKKDILKNIPQEKRKEQIQLVAILFLVHKALKLLEFLCKNDALRIFTAERNVSLASGNSEVIIVTYW